MAALAGLPVPVLLPTALLAPVLLPTVLLLYCRYGLYVAEALHARFLPLQFIGFANTWAQVRCT